MNISMANTRSKGLNQLHHQFETAVKGMVMAKTKTLILIRHALTETNEANRSAYLVISGRMDSKLTTEGRAQAIALLGYPALAKADLFLSSPSPRAIETAIYSTGRSRSDVFTDDRLHERSLGKLEGRNVSDLVRDPRYSAFFSDEEMSRKYRHSFNFRVPGGEHYGDVVARTRQCMVEYLEKIPAGGKLVVFSHMVAIRCILHWALNLSEEETLRLKILSCQPIILKMDNSFSGILVRPDRKELTWL